MGVMTVIVSGEETDASKRPLQSNKDIFLSLSAVYHGTSHSLEQRFIDWMKGIGSLHFGPGSYTQKRFQNQSQK